MTPKEKAIEILNKFADIEICIDAEPKYIEGTLKEQKQYLTIRDCALVLVEQMLDSKVFPMFWKEVQIEIQNSNPSYLRAI